jgi:hypothetical protein
MSVHAMPLEEIRRPGLAALAGQIGPVSVLRVLQQFETEMGDYTAERQEWLPHSGVQDPAREIREQRRT